MMTHRLMFPVKPGDVEAALTPEMFMLVAGNCHSLSKAFPQKAMTLCLDCRRKHTLPPLCREDQEHRMVP